MVRRIVCIGCLFALLLLTGSALGGAADFFALKPAGIGADPAAVTKGTLSKAALFDFPGEFAEEGEETLITDTEYRSRNIHLVITKQRIERTDVTIVDIHVRSLDCLCRAFGNDTWGGRSFSVSRYAAMTDCVLCMSGDSSAALYGGLIVGNGYVWENKSNIKRDVCVLWKNGVMECFTHTQLEKLGIRTRAGEVWQTFFFGPMVLGSNGEVLSSKSAFSYTDVWVRNPRSVIGYIEPGHYVLVLVTGRSTPSSLVKNGKNFGLDLSRVSELMAELGCKAAYNLDGGQSAVLWYNGSVISETVNGGRPVGDVILLREPGTDISAVPEQ